MQEVNFEQTLERIVRRDSRYHREAYLFLREALDHTQKVITKGGKEPLRHVSGQELLAGIRDFALEQFGPMTLTVFHEWGLRKCEDFGELVFNMVDANLLSKTAEDSRADFAGGYDFEEAFQAPFLPTLPSRAPKPAREAKPK
jgi:uncharacterized repeat protein (TIGR04138 family)